MGILKNIVKKVGETPVSRRSVLKGIGIAAMSGALNPVTAKATAVAAKLGTTALAAAPLTTAGLAASTTNVGKKVTDKIIKPISKPINKGFNTVSDVIDKGADYVGDKVSDAGQKVKSKLFHEVNLSAPLSSAMTSIKNADKISPENKLLNAKMSRRSVLKLGALSAFRPMEKATTAPIKSLYNISNYGKTPDILNGKEMTRRAVASKVGAWLTTKLINKISPSKQPMQEGLISNISDKWKKANEIGKEAAKYVGPSLQVLGTTSKVVGSGLNTIGKAAKYVGDKATDYSKK